LIVGFKSGKINLYDTKAMKLLSIINNAHLVKSEEGVNCLAVIQSGDNDGAEKNPSGQLPFFVSGGADSMIKIYEHNPYMPLPEDEGDKNIDEK
jgi:hypothetical protein